MPRLFTIFAVALVVSLVNLSQVKGEHHRIIIHVPYHIKTIKHTHTITKHILHNDHDDGKDESPDHSSFDKPDDFESRDNWGGHSYDFETWLDARLMPRFRFGDELGGAIFEGYQ